MRKFLQVGISSLLITGAIAALGVTPAAATPPFSYTFNSTVEGWKANAGVGELDVPATFSASGGNPGGATSIADNNNQGVDFFKSPGSIAGNYGANFGGTLRVDSKSTKTWSEENVVALFGSANGEAAVCVFEEGVFPGTTYKTSNYTLDSAHTYLINEIGECDTHPTDVQLSELLSTFIGILIGGEDVAGSSETTTIDNVILSGGAPLPLHTLTLLRAGTGAGTVTSSPAGIDCGPTCSKGFVAGAPVTLTATPSSGSTFAGWSGGGCTGTGTCQVTLSADREVTAIFDTAPAAGGGGAAGAGNGGSAGTSPSAVPTPKSLKCKKGFKKKTVHGKAKCVRKKKRHHH
jgi:hypothetical protein